MSHSNNKQPSTTAIKELRSNLSNHSKTLFRCKEAYSQTVTEEVITCSDVASRVTATAVKRSHAIHTPVTTTHAAKRKVARRVVTSLVKRVAISHAINVAITHAIKVAISHAIKVAITHAIKVAISHAIKVAITHAINVAITHAKKVATSHAKKVATSHVIRVVISHAIRRNHAVIRNHATIHAKKKSLAVREVTLILARRRAATKAVLIIRIAVIAIAVLSRTVVINKRAVIRNTIAPSSTALTNKNHAELPMVTMDSTSITNKLSSPKVSVNNQAIKLRSGYTRTSIDEMISDLSYSNKICLFIRNYQLKLTPVFYLSFY
jgi:hypothetical protein